MALTNECFDYEREHLGGVQRVYKLENGFSLSCVNAQICRLYPFAWEVAVKRDGEITYDTPLTDDVEVFDTDEETNKFIFDAIAYAKTHSRDDLETFELLSMAEKMAT